MAKSELEAVAGDHEQLIQRYKDAKSRADAAQRTEEQLRQQIQDLTQQLRSARTSGGDGGDQSEKLQRFRAASSRQIEVLQLRVAKAASRIASLETELEGKSQENIKLTQISDTLIAMLESASLDE